MILGYFMIWGRIGGVFFGIVTLSATLVLAFFLGQTAGPEWHIGNARLNGFNGMKGMDPLTIPWFGDSRSTSKAHASTTSWSRSSSWSISRCACW